MEACKFTRFTSRTMLGVATTLPPLLQCWCHRDQLGLVEQVPPSGQFLNEHRATRIVSEHGSRTIRNSNFTHRLAARTIQFVNVTTIFPSQKVTVCHILPCLSCYRIFARSPVP